jgi:hypothetical protein
VRKVDLTSPSSVEAGNDWSLLPLPHIRVNGGWQGIRTETYPLGMAVCGRQVWCEHNGDVQNPSDA